MDKYSDLPMKNGDLEVIYDGQKNQNMKKNEQCSKPWLVDDHKGFYYPICWGLW